MKGGHLRRRDGDGLVDHVECDRRDSGQLRAVSCWRRHVPFPQGTFRQHQVLIVRTSPVYHLHVPLPQGHCTPLTVQFPIIWPYLTHLTLKPPSIPCHKKSWNHLHCILSFTFNASTQCAQSDRYILHSYWTTNFFFSAKSGSLRKPTCCATWWGCWATLLRCWRSSSAFATQSSLTSLST